MGQLKFGAMKVETMGGQHLFEVQLYLDDLDPDAVRVELFANGAGGGSALCQEMKFIRRQPGPDTVHVYGATFQLPAQPLITPLG